MSTAPMAEETTGSAYRRLFDLSRGGMGSVELTVRREGRFQRLYAVKRLLPAIRDEATARRMFVEEGRLAGLIHHPNVVGVLDVGEDQDGPYLVMEYIDGVTVRDLVRNAASTGLPLPVQLCCRIGAQAARGLATAHSLTSHEGTNLQLVHRDISPQNILVGYDGVVRVADFGIARAVDRDHRTSTGVLKGKLGYMAPEILRFEHAQPRSDLFSFGVVLYEMLAGARLYGGRDDAARARAILNEPPPDILDAREDVPVALQALLLQLMAKDPALRPASANEVVEVLEAVAAELAAEEGKLDIAEFVEDGFADTRDARRDEVKRALAAVADAVDEPASDSVDDDASDAVQGPLVNEREPTTPARAPRSRVAAGVVGVALLVAGAGIGAFWAQGSGTEDVTAPPEDATVTVSLSSEPEGARVIAEGLAPTTTPATLRLPTGADRVRLRFELEGHEPVTEWVTPDVDQRLRVQLEEASAPPVDEEASAERASADVSEPSTAPVSARPPARARTRRRPRRTRAPDEEAASPGFFMFGD